MCQHRTRAPGQIAVAIVVWSSCLPLVSACSFSTFGTSCDSSQRIMIGVIAASVLVIVLMICGLCFRRQLRTRRRVLRLSGVPFDGMGGRSSIPPKPQRPLVSSGYGYPMYNQATSTVPPPVYMPQYPPRGYDTYPGYSRPQSTAYTPPEPSAPISPASIRAPSNTTSRPISTLDTTSFSPRSSVRREESSTTVSHPPSSSSPILSHNTQPNVVEPPPSPSPPRTQSVTIPPASALSPRPIGVTSRPNVSRPSVLSPMHTGVSNAVEEPPPAYTPI